MCFYKYFVGLYFIIGKKWLGIIISVLNYK